MHLGHDFKIILHRIISAVYLPTSFCFRERISLCWRVGNQTSYSVTPRTRCTISLACFRNFASRIQEIFSRQLPVLGPFLCSTLHRISYFPPKAFKSLHWLNREFERRVDELRTGPTFSKSCGSIVFSYWYASYCTRPKPEITRNPA